MNQLETTYTIRVGELAHARSGDKGNTANIGVLAYTEAAYAWLKQELTPEVVKHHFRSVCHGEVDCFELPNLLALNFVLHDVLGGGGSRSLRIDAQGKALGQAVLQIKIPAPSAYVIEEARQARVAERPRTGSPGSEVSDEP
jgi:hypothetical protein